MKKIAVASEGNMVTEHFGHCSNFNIFETKGDKIIKTQSIDSPGHKPGFIPNFLNDLGVDVVVSGGMGGGAVDIFNDKGIQVVIGVKGEAETVVSDYLKGRLEFSGSVCQEHRYHDECGRG
ncbi:MAG: dinitrogenase iron-molybdenum cofactor [Clostridia bacterium]|nr:dinitrogenase iron-molybdenum cofactor [Clostridia bacterium]